MIQSTTDTSALMPEDRNSRVRITGKSITSRKNREGPITESNDFEIRATDGGQVTTDGQILYLAIQALDASPFRQLRDLQVYCENGRITLQGLLPTYYLKQVAQEVVHTVVGVRDIDNDVKVARPR